MSVEQRQAIENGIWCCADHGRLIDTNRGYKFPAELLKHWKALHEARIAREMGGSSTVLGWVDQLEVVNSFLFEPSAILRFSKSTLLRGDEAAGKSAICEWIAGFCDSRHLNRWKAHDHDLRLRYFSPEAETLRLAVGRGEINRYRGDTFLPSPPRDVRVVFLSEYYERRRRDFADDVAWLTDIFQTEPAVIRELCDDVRVNGHPFCRRMEVRELHVHNEEEDTDGHFLFVATGNRSPLVPLSNLSTSEQIAAVVQLAAAMGRLEVRHAPTMLLLDSGGWNWSEQMFSWFAPFWARQPYQVVLIHAYQPVDLQAPEWTGWAAVEIQDIGPGRNKIVELKP